MKYGRCYTCGAWLPVRKMRWRKVPTFLHQLAVLVCDHCYDQAEQVLSKPKSSVYVATGRR